MEYAKSKFAEDGKTPLKLVRKRLEWVKRQILKTPERYDQRKWHYQEDCKTVGCLAGWLDVKMRGFRLHQEAPYTEVRMNGIKALGLLSEPDLFGGDLCSIHPAGSIEAAQYACRKIDQYLESVGA